MVYALGSYAFIIGDLVEPDQHSSIPSQSITDFVQEEQRTYLKLQHSSIFYNFLLCNEIFAKILQYPIT